MRVLFEHLGPLLTHLSHIRSPRMLVYSEIVIGASSISTRPRRASYSNDNENPRIRSCLRSITRDKDGTGLRGTTIISPSLSPLVEDSTLSSVSSESKRSGTLEAMVSPTAIANVACPSTPPALSSAEASTPNSSSQPTLSHVSMAKAISSASYLSRRRGASLSSAPMPPTSSPSCDIVMASPPPPSPTLTKASTFSNTSFSSSQSNSGASPQTQAERPILQTIPLQPCCKACIATLEAHPSSLLPIASEADANWTPRARAKKVADEKEGEAIRAAASESAKANMGCIMRLWGDGPSSHLHDHTENEGQDGIEVAMANTRSPLSPESLKRNRKLRESFNSELGPNVGNQLRAMRLDDGGIEGKGLSADSLDSGELSSPNDDLKNLADLGLHALRLHGQIGSRTGDLFDEEEELDNDEEAAAIDDGTETEVDDEARQEDEQTRYLVPVANTIGARGDVSVPNGAVTPGPRPLDRTRSPASLIRSRGRGPEKGFSSLDTVLSSPSRTGTMPTPPRSHNSTDSQSPLASSSSAKSTSRRPAIARSVSEGGAAPPTSFKSVPSNNANGSGSEGMGFMGILRRKLSKDFLPSPSPSASSSPPSTRAKSGSTSSGTGSLNILSSFGRLPGIGA